MNTTVAGLHRRYKAYQALHGEHSPSVRLRSTFTRADQGRYTFTPTQAKVHDVWAEDGTYSSHLKFTVFGGDATQPFTIHDHSGATSLHIWANVGEVQAGGTVTVTVSCPSPTRSPPPTRGKRPSPSRSRPRMHPRNATWA